MSTEPFGQWAFVYDCSVEPDLLDRVPGLRPSNVFVLPPEFTRSLQATGFLDRVNRRFNTLIDFYEEEDVSSAALLCFLAGGLNECFQGHEMEGLVGDLAGFILECAASGLCLTFRL